MAVETSLSFFGLCIYYCYPLRLQPVLFFVFFYWLQENSTVLNKV